MGRLTDDDELTVELTEDELAELLRDLPTSNLK